MRISIELKVELLTVFSVAARARTSTSGRSRLRGLRLIRSAFALFFGNSRFAAIEGLWRSRAVIAYGSSYPLIRGRHSRVDPRERGRSAAYSPAHHTYLDIVLPFRMASLDYERPARVTRETEKENRQTDPLDCFCHQYLSLTPGSCLR